MSEPLLEASGAEDGIAIEVVARILADRAESALRPLADYLELFPGHEEVVAKEYLRVPSGSAPAPAAAPAPAPAPAPAKKLQDAERSEYIGRFRLMRELGRGGQGSVWLVHDTRLDRPVALKVVPVSPLSGSAAPRFRREARAASRLSHPGICTVYDAGLDDSLAWIAMQYVPGRTLEELLAERGSEPLDAAGVRAAVALFTRLAEALHAAHEVGIVHRDVKPSNIVVTPAGDPVLLDFGIAGETADGARLTLTGQALGTPAYMSPEHLEGRHEHLDGRSDVWSLGATAYEYLTGRRPFEEPTRERLVQAILRNEFERPSQLAPAVPRDLDVVLATALTKEVDRRYRSALEFAHDLERVRAGRPILARRISAGERLARLARRNPGVATSVLAVIAVLAVALVGTALLLDRTSAALRANRTLLGEVTQLADAKLAGDLLAEERTLWPANPDRAEELGRWLEKAQDLEARLDLHRASLAAVGESLRLDVSLRMAELARSAATETQAWMEEQLTEIIAGIEELVRRIPSVEARYELARTLRERTLEQPRADWEAAAARVALDPRFASPDGTPFQLIPQLGLVPLGPDPQSGLEEFGHPQSGAPPERDPETGALRFAAESSVVLVLVPGGRAAVGCVPPGPGAPAGMPRVDPGAQPHDGPVTALRLDPFFMAKHELTVGQWERHTGQNPALYAKNPEIPAEVRATQPVEQVNFLACTAFFAELDLVLPTEAQWEHAARGGTETVWYTGDDERSIDGHVNLSDEWSRTRGGGSRWDYVPWLADEAVVTAPVASYLPNPFGLHDVMGNVCEWTRTSWAGLDAFPPLDGAGETQSDFSARVVRGGSFAKPAANARMGFRDYLPGQLSPPDVGVRAARAVESAP